MQAIGSRIVALMQAKGVTAYEVSRATGISEGTLSRIKSGAKPNQATRETLAANSTWSKSRKWILITVKNRAIIYLCNLQPLNITISRNNPHYYTFT